MASAGAAAAATGRQPLAVTAVDRWLRLLAEASGLVQRRTLPKRTHLKFEIQKLHEVALHTVLS